MTSAKVGHLAIGEVFEVLEERWTNGQARFRMSRGWVSVTARSGKPLCVDEASVQLFLQTVPLLQHLTEENRAEIAESLTATEFEQGIPIVTQGDVGDAMYFLERGTAQAEVVDVSTDALGDSDKPNDSDDSESDEDEDENDAKIVLNYVTGNFFGELALLTDQPRAATVRATGSDGARCLKLSREVFDRFVRGNTAILDERKRLYKERREMQRRQKQEEREAKRAAREAERQKKIEERERERQQRMEKRAAEVARREEQKAAEAVKREQEKAAANLKREQQQAAQELERQSHKATEEEKVDQSKKTAVEQQKIEKTFTVTEPRSSRFEQSNNGFVPEGIPPTDGTKRTFEKQRTTALKQWIGSDSILPPGVVRSRLNGNLMWAI